MKRTYDSHSVQVGSRVLSKLTPVFIHAKSSSHNFCFAYALLTFFFSVEVNGLNP